MHLIVNHMAQFKHVYNAYCCRLVESFACATIIEVSFSELGKFCLFGVFSDLSYCSTIENWCREGKSKFLSGPPKNSLVDLSKVHPRRYTQRVQNNINRCAILKERHIFSSYYPGNNTFVTMTTGHFISDFNLTLLSYIYFGKTYNTSRQFISDSDIIFLAFVNAINLLIFNYIVMEQLFDTVIFLFIGSPFIRIGIQKINFLKLFQSELTSFRNYINIQIIFNPL